MKERKRECIILMLPLKLFSEEFAIYL